MKKNNTCLPLKLIRQTAQEYPAAWEQMDYFHSLRDTAPDMSWPEWCWVPMAAAITVVQDADDRAGGIIPSAQTVRDFQLIDAVAPWRHSKQIYRMDPDLEKELTDDPAASDTIPAEILKHLPYPCVYIQTNTITCFGTLIDGFFAHLEYDTDTHDSELRFLPVSQNGTVLQGLSLHIDRPTIQDAFVRFRAVMNKRSRELLGNNIPAGMTDQQIRELESACRKLLPLVVYICAAESDVMVAKPAEKTEKEKAGSHAEPPVRDRYAEVQAWNVGYRIGPAIRKYYENRKAETASGEHSGSHTPKRPHIRRAHWHHFWAGAENNRHLIVKWISPIFVNVGQDTDLPATIHPVQ